MTSSDPRSSALLMMGGGRAGICKTVKGYKPVVRETIRAKTPMAILETGKRIPSPGKKNLEVLPLQEKGERKHYLSFRK